MKCEQCHAENEPVLYRGWNAGGMKQMCYNSFIAVMQDCHTTFENRLSLCAASH